MEDIVRALPPQINKKDVTCVDIRVSLDDYEKVLKLVQRYEKQKESQRKKYREHKNDQIDTPHKKVDEPIKLDLVKVVYVDKKTMEIKNIDVLNTIN